MSTTALRVAVPLAPRASDDSVRAVMVANSRKRDTRPERALRSALHARGLRYRANLKIGQGRSAPRPDVVFTRAKVAVFLDGCFWHSCPDHGVSPKTNSQYWSSKLARNKQRDLENDATLASLGWHVIRVWEHEDAGDAAEVVAEVVRGRGHRYERSSLKIH